MPETQLEYICKQFVRYPKSIALDVQEQLTNNYETMDINMISSMNLLFLFPFATL